MAYPVGAATLQHTTTASTTVTVTLPTHAAGDLLVIFLSQNVGSTAISESSAFSWTVLNPSSVTGDARMAVAYKYSSGGGESNPTFTGTVTNAWSVQTIVVRDADPTTYVCGTASKTFTTNPVASPALTTVDADDAYGPILLLYGWCFDGTETLGRCYTSDLVALGLEAGDYIAEVTDKTISSIVGYRNQVTYGAVPSINAYGIVAAEGGNAWVVAIKNKSGGVVAPDVRSGMTELNWYGNFGAVHQAVTWQAPSNFAATINSITVDTVAASTATSSGNNQTPWGTLTYLERNNSVASQWTGGSHTISSTNMWGKVFSLQWQINAVSTSLYIGTDAVIIGFSDGTKWVTYRLIKLLQLPASNAPSTNHIALGNSTEYANSEGTSTSTIDWTAITRVMYCYHRIGSVATTGTLYIKNATLHGPSVITGGSQSRPAKYADLKKCLEGFGHYGLVGKQGLGQIMGKNSVTIGDGSSPTYFSASAQSFEFPEAYSVETQYKWNANNNSVAFSIYASASDTISLSAGVVATDTIQPFGFNASSSASASYPMVAASIVGFDVTLDTDIPITGATFSEGGEIAGVGTDLTDVVISATTSTDAAHSVTENGVVMDGCTIDVTNTSALYHLELGTSVTAITLTDVTFTGAPTSLLDKVHVLKTTGTVTITISGTTTLVAGDVTTAGATVDISGPTVNQVVIVSGFTAGSRIQIYDTTNSIELFNGTASAGDTVVSGSTATWTDPTAAAGNRAIRVRVAYVSGVTAKLWQENTGLTCGVTSGTESITYPITQVADTTYDDNAVSMDATIFAACGITFTDAATDLVNINIAADTVALKTIYAAFAWWLFTALGIDDDVAYIDAPNTANYVMTSMKFRNTSTDPLKITGGYFYDTTGSVENCVDITSPGNIYPMPVHVVAYQTTGTYAITGDLQDALDAIADVPADVLAAAVEGTTTIAESLRLHNAVIGGMVSGAGTATETFRDLANTKDRVVATVDSNGNRTVITRDLT